MRIGSLFSGIGLLERGLEMSGLGQVTFQVEIDPFCQRVLAKHWPNVPRFDDVRMANKATLPPADVICGGFPCTDLSHVARGVARNGLAGEQSGLWYEMLRIIGELGPRVVVIENVANAWRDWLPVVRSDLHGLGYSSVPVRLRAADVGAPHGRARVFVVAYPHSDRERYSAFHAEARRFTEAVCARGHWRSGPAKALGMDDDGRGGMDMARRRSLGNAVVPQCAEVIGMSIAKCLDLQHNQPFRKRD